MAWCHQSTNVDLSSVRSSNIHLRVISQEISQSQISEISLKIIYLTFHLNLPGTSELTLLPLYASVNQVSIGSDNGLSPIRRQAIIWTNAGLLSVESLGTIFSEILTRYKTFHSRKCIWKCHLWKGGLFVQGEMSVFVFLQPLCLMPYTKPIQW